MRLSEVFVTEAEPTNTYYSEGLRLRPNYLLYGRRAELQPEQKSYLAGAKIPWAEYSNTSLGAALISLLKSFTGGIYMPSIGSELNLATPVISIFLLDPHLIGEFENRVSKNRLGVAIRRHILASFDFQETIDLGG